MDPRVLVYGWYGRGNLGDELMKLSLERLLHDHGLEPQFVDVIDDVALEGAAGTIFGGGSILADDPNVTLSAVKTLASGHVPVFYVGVGGETDISPIHQVLINSSRVVAFRELDIPDLAYSLNVNVPTRTVPGTGVLVVPNVELVPTTADPHWKHVAWEHFKTEFSQVLDRCVQRKHPVSFMRVCMNPKQDDAWAACELMSRMTLRDSYPSYMAADLVTACSLVQRSRVVITQRYHGIVLAEMAGVPYVSVNHHNKLSLAHPHRGPSVSYYGVQKDPLWDLIESAMAMQIEPHRPPRSVYDDIMARIVAVIKERG
jgi:hypothetical protein